MSTERLTESLAETLAQFDRSGTPRTTTEVADRLDLGRRSTYDRLDRLVDAEALETKKVGASARVWWRPASAVDTETNVPTPDCPEAAASLVDVLDGTDVGVFVLDADFRVAWINETTERFFGLDRERVLGRDKREVIEERIAPTVADSDAFRETVLATYDDSAGAEEFECRVAADDGAERWLEHRSRPVTTGEYAGGRVELYTDVTDRKRSERRLKRQRDDLRRELDDVFDRVDDAVYALDDEFRFTFVNDRAEEQLGRTETELLGRNVWEALSVSVDDPIRDCFETAMATQEPATFERYSESCDIWREGRVYPSESGLSVYFSDVTERRERERELERYAGLVDAVGEPVYEVDAAGRLTFVNDAFVEYSGYAESELLGEHVSLGMDENAIERVEAEILDLLADDGDGTRTVEYEVIPKEGGRIPVENRLTLLTDDDGRVRGSAGVLRDVSDRKERERELVRQREQLEALNNLSQAAREITGAVIEQSTREEIEETVCEHLADSDSYSFAWIGDVDAATQTVNLRTEAGVDGYLDGITISVDPDDERGDGPTGRAYRTGTTQTTRDVRTDSRHDPWRDHVESHEMRSSAAVPIAHEGTTYGVLNVYADRPRAFEGRERAVVDQLGEVVGHAIAATDRKRALMSDEVVELEFRVPDVFDVAGADPAPPGRMSLDYATPASDGEFVVFGTVTADAVDGLQRLVANVSHWRDVHVADSDGEGDARFELHLSEPPVLSVLASVGGSVERAVIADGDYEMTIRASPSVEVRRITETVREQYPTAEFLRRRQTTRDEPTANRVSDAVSERLTDRQRSTLGAAFHAGFFEWPRAASGEEVADSLGIAPPTFHQHLRKAERKVIDSVLETDGADV